MRQVPDKLRPAPSRRLTLAVVTAALVVAAGACTSAKDLTAQETTTTAATSTTRPAPTSTYPVPPATPISIPRAGDGTTPDGSGCDPPSSQTLTDGIWFGVLKSVDASSNTIGLDLACYFSAATASTTVGTAVTTEPPLNDYSIRNNVPTVYTLKASPQVAVLSLADAGTGGDGEFNPTTTGVASANAILTDQSHKYVWVQITHGYVVVIQGQFTP